MIDIHKIYATKKENLALSIYYETLSNTSKGLYGKFAFFKKVTKRCN